MEKTALILLLITLILHPQSINDLIPKNEQFFIQSSLNAGQNLGGYWDISGGESNIKEGAKIQVWELGKNEKDRRYVIEPSQKNGFVRIHIDGVAGYLTVEGGKDKNGAKLEIKGPDNSASQNFTFRYMGNSRFKIYAENGMQITLENRSSKNGKAVQMWEDHEGEWNEWCLISTASYKLLNLDKELEKLAGSLGDDMKGINTVYIQSAVSYGRSLNGYFDTPGTDFPEEGDNVQVYRLSDFNPDRLFTIIPSNSSIVHYSIAVADDNTLLLEAADNGTVNGTNIEIREMNNSAAQNFYFKHLGAGRYKIFTQTGKVVCLNNRSDENKVNVHIWDDHDGAWMEWYLIDAETNKPHTPAGLKGGNPDINSVSLSGASDPKINNLGLKIDELFTATIKEEERSAAVLAKVIKSGMAVGEARRVSQKVNSLHAKTTGIVDALVPFEKLPMIGAGVKGLTAGLNMGVDQLGKVNSSLEKIKESVIEPAADDMEYALRQNIFINSQLNYLKIYLVELKKEIAFFISGKNSSSIKPDINAYLTEISDLNSMLNVLDKNLLEIEKNCKQLSKIEEPSKKVGDGVRKFDRSLKQVDKVADQINKVLDKRFKKEIAKVKINISVRDVISGGKVGKVFDKYVSDWLEDAIKPVMKSLKVKIPTIPGADKLKETLANSIDFTKKIKSNTDSLEAVSSKLTYFFRNRVPAG